ncbi:MAG: Alpha-D-kanosaminyltransferase [Planctomycetota bacterium]
MSAILECAGLKSGSEKETRRLRVLHLINGEHYAGAERVQDLLGRYLPELGIDLGFACLKPDRFPLVRQSRDVPLWNVRMRGRVDLAVAGNIFRLIRDNNFQLLHAHTPRSLLVGRIAAALARVPVVYHVHSPVQRDSTDRLRNWINAAFERGGLNGVPQLICVSQSLRNYLLERGCEPEKISVVPNGVPTIDCSEKAPRSDGMWTLGTVALLRPRKGIEVLLDAIALLRTESVPVRVRIVGPFESAEYEGALRQRAADLNIEDAVEWFGFTKHAQQEMQKFDLFVLPSLFGEGMPMVVLESMTAGTPVIASDVEGIPEVIRDGQDGLIVPPNSPRHLADAVKRFVNGEVDYAAVRCSALRRQREQFSADAMAKGVADVYRRLLPD